MAENTPKIILPESGGQARPQNAFGTVTVVGDKGLKQTKIASISKEADLQREALLERAFFSQVGMQKLAQALVNPVKRFMDIHGVMRKVLVTEQKNQGELAYYDLDLEMIPAVEVGNAGSTHMVIFQAERRLLERMEIAINALIPLSELSWRKYDVLMRARDRVRQGLVIKEDTKLFSLLDSTIGTANPKVGNGTASLTLSDLAAGAETIERWNVPSYTFIMNYHAVADIRSWNNSTIDEVGRIEIRQTGFLGRLWGNNVIITPLVPVVTGAGGTKKTYVYTLSSPEFVGYAPFWVDTMILASNNIADLKLGFVGYEVLGMTIWNARGVAVIEFAI
ncbi:MAG: HK97-fold major capsid protein [Nitrososphaeria archaeon]